MKAPLLTIAVMLFVAEPTGRAQKPPGDAQDAIDKARAELKESLAGLTALDESDRALATSNQAQVDTTQMLKTLEARLQRTDIPELRARIEEWNRKRQQYIDSGCPPDGGVVPPALVERCEPTRVALNRERAKLDEDAAAIEKTLASIADGRKAVSETTVANVRKRKDNLAQREALEAARVRQEAALRRLYSARIVAAARKLELRAKAATACRAIPNDEEAACCLQVVNDGRKPEQCDVPLIYEYFERGGVFQTPVVKSRGARP